MQETAPLENAQVLENSPDLHDQSEVAKKKPNQGKIWWLVAAIGVIGGYGVWTFYPEKSTHEENLSPNATQTATMNQHLDEAKRNLATLEQQVAQEQARLREAKKQQQSLMAGAAGDPEGHRETYSKLYLARMNAPTTVYEATANQGGATRENSATLSAKDNNETLASTSPFLSKSVHTLEAERLPHPDFTITQGTLFHATLEPAVNTDLPGIVRAVVSTPVYSSTGSMILLPKGTRLIGAYQAAVTQGQNRIFLMWTRAITPDAISIQLNSPSTDSLGRGGLAADEINTHFWERFGQAALLSVLSAGASNAGVNANTQYNSQSAYRQSISDALGESATQSLQGSIAIKPTLMAYQGKPIEIFVAQDLSLHAVYHSTTLQGPTTLPLSAQQIARLKTFLKPGEGRHGV